MNGTHNLKAYVPTELFDLVKHSYWFYNPDNDKPRVYRRSIVSNRMYLDKFILLKTLHQEDVDDLKITHLDFDPLNCEVSNLLAIPSPLIYQPITVSTGTHMTVATTDSAYHCWLNDNWFLRPDGSITNADNTRNLYAAVLRLENVPGVSIKSIDNKPPRMDCFTDCRPDNFIVTHSNIAITIAAVKNFSVVPVTINTINSHPERIKTEYKTRISSEHYTNVKTNKWRYDPTPQLSSLVPTDTEPRCQDGNLTLSEYIVTLMVGHIAKFTHRDGDISNNTPENLDIKYDPLEVVEKWRKRWVNNTIWNALNEMYHDDLNIDIDRETTGRNNATRLIFQLPTLPTPVVGNIKCHEECELQCAGIEEGCCRKETFAIIDELVQTRRIIELMRDYFASTIMIPPLVDIVSQYLTGDISSPQMTVDNLVSLCGQGYMLTPIEYARMGNIRLRLLYDFWQMLENDCTYYWYRENKNMVNPGKLKVLDTGAWLILAAREEESEAELADILNAAIKKYGKLPDTGCMDAIKMIPVRIGAISTEEIRDMTNILDG